MRECNMKIVSIISQKGGVGKTTLSTTLAIEAIKNKKKVILLDLDPQASASFWNDSRQNKNDLAVTAIPPARLEHYLKASKDAGVDFVFIDTPPFAKDIAYDAAKFADLVIIPTKPAVLDIIAMTRTADLIKVFNKKSFVILTFCPPMGKEIEEAKDAVKLLNLDLCPIKIGNRIAYSRAQQFGQAAQEYEPNGKASKEIKQLYKYICIHV